MNNSKNEIQNIIDHFDLFEDLTLTNSKDLRWIMQNLNRHSPFEKPDAFIKQSDIVYGIEHFQVSMYAMQKQSDLSRIAKGSQCNREKMSADRDFNLCPSIGNLLSALRKNLSSHAKSFGIYKENLQNNECAQGLHYRLIIFVEDSSESGYIVRKYETKPINPLLLKQVAEIFLEYKNDIWGVIMTTGNEKQKKITGCTLNELQNKLNCGELLDAREYAPLEDQRNIHVSKNDPSKDSNNITIKLFDRI